MEEFRIRILHHSAPHHSARILALVSSSGVFGYDLAVVLALNIRRPIADGYLHAGA